MHPRTRLLVGVALALPLIGCNCGQRLTDPNDPANDPNRVDVTGCPDDVSGLELTPGDQSASVAAGQTFSFQAKLMLTSTRFGLVTDRAVWTVTREDDGPAGSVALGIYTPAPGVGGKIKVTASDCGVSGSAVLTLSAQTSVVAAGPDTKSVFDGPLVTTAPAKTPLVVYPSDKTRFPRNIYKTLFQWTRNGNSLFRLTFTGPYSTVVVYTDGTLPSSNPMSTACAAAAPAAGCWEADADTWARIASSNAGEITQFTVDGVTNGDANVYRSKTLELGYSRRDVRGAIFYWSTTAAGVRRASVSDAQPEPYVVAKPTATVLTPGGTVKCVACHTVSRSGKKMVAFTQAASSGIFVYDVTLQPPPKPVVTSGIATAKGFGTFSPDDSRLVATVGNVLKEFDLGNSAALVTQLPMAEGTNPDWSPRNDQLAYSDQGGDSPAGADLEVIARAANGSWGARTVLVPAGGSTNLFPSYTHDGAYLAYARGKGGHGDKTLQLWMVDAAGGKAPVELLNANRIANNQLTAGQFENNMPTWAPAGDLEWVAFNSLRPYGVVKPGGGTQQIWVAAIDRSKLAAGEDPSFPAFRFAFQDLAEDNHRAFWTEDVRVPTDQCLKRNEDCTAGTTACCLGLDCIATSELTAVCLPPGGSGSCLGDGATCDQSSGSPCCAGLVCDANGSGGFACKSNQVCPTESQACTSSTACCSGLTCINGGGTLCTGSTGCSCQLIFQ